MFLKLWHSGTHKSRFSASAGSWHSLYLVRSQLDYMIDGTYLVLVVGLCFDSLMLVLSWFIHDWPDLDSLWSHSWFAVVFWSSNYKIEQNVAMVWGKYR